jgi:hypothetical protein
VRHMKIRQALFTASREKSFSPISQVEWLVNASGFTLIIFTMMRLPNGIPSVRVALRYHVASYLKLGQPLAWRANQERGDTTCS